MSDISYAPPPPPPPAPPAAPRQGFDFARPFAFVFDDPRWLSKILIGGLFTLASVLLIGVFFTMGYCARLCRNVVAGMSHPLPEWDDLGDYFVEGLQLVVIVLIYTIPFIAIAMAFFVPAGILNAVSGHHDDVANVFGGGLATCGVCLFLPLGIAFAIYLPGALLMAVVDRRFGAGFEVGRILRFIRDNLGNYILAIIVYFIVRMLVPFGVILLCVGILFTGFWAMLVATYAFSDVYRLSRVK